MSKQDIELSTLEKYNNVPSNIKEDFDKAVQWASSKLEEKDKKSQYIIDIIVAGQDAVSCRVIRIKDSTFHTGSPMEDRAKAVVMAVCEYLAEYNKTLTTDI